MSFDLQRVRRQLMADKKKLGMLMTLAALGLLLWGRLLLQPVPRTAVADPNLLSSAAMPRGRETIAAPETARRVIETPLKATVERDLFALQPELFPRASEREEKPSGSEEKLSTKTTDELQRRRLAVELAARELKLQSTLLGQRRRALINGVLLEAGQKIAGFTLVNIASRQVTLEKDGVVVVLEM